MDPEAELLVSIAGCRCQSSVGALEGERLVLAVTKYFEVGSNRARGLKSSCTKKAISHSLFGGSGAPQHRDRPWQHPSVYSWSRCICLLPDVFFVMLNNISSPWWVCFCLQGSFLLIPIEPHRFSMAYAKGVYNAWDFLSARVLVTQIDAAILFRCRQDCWAIGLSPKMPGL